MPDELATARAEVLTVPPGVKCIHVSLAGERSLNRSFSVSPGASTVTLDLGPIPLGRVEGRAAAYNATCPSATSPPGSPATWIADPVERFVQAGMAESFAFVFHPVTPGSASADFETPVVDIAVGYVTTYAVLADGTVWRWGARDHVNPQLPLDIALLPEPFPGLNNITQVSTHNGKHACALRGDGRVFCWGANHRGQLGNGSVVGTMSPVEVNGLTDVVQVSVGADHTCALRADRSALCWGDNTFSQLGVGLNGGGSSVATPVVFTPFQGLASIRAIEAGSHATCIVRSDGWIGCAGRRPDGTQTNTFNGAVTPAAFDVGMGYQEACAVRGDGRVLCWGVRHDNTVVSTPTLVEGVTDVVQVSQGWGYHCGVQSNGRARCWGFGAMGNLGDGTGLSSNIAVEVKGLSDVVEISGAGHTTCALRATGSVSCWGTGYSGGLGNDSLDSSFTPTPVLFPN